MKPCVLVGLALSLILSGKWLGAQQVRYSPIIEDSFSIAGKAGHFYWIERKEKLRMSRHPARWSQPQAYDLYKERMDLVYSTPSMAVLPTTLKEHYVFGDEYFDQLLLMEQPHGVRVCRDSSVTQIVYKPMPWPGGVALWRGRPDRSDRPNLDTVKHVGSPFAK